MAKEQKSINEALPNQVEEKGVLCGIQKSTDRISQISLNLFKIAMVLIVFGFFIIILFKGVVFANAGGMIIEPFEVTGFGADKENNINGLALADLLSYELHRIKEIDDLGQRDTITPIIEVRASDELSGYSNMEFIDLKTKSTEKSISELGTVSVEPASFSLGGLILSIRELLGYKPSTITGSLQSYGGIISMVVKLEDNSSSERSIWKVEQAIPENNQSLEAQVIPSLAKDLAFKVALEMSQRQAKSKGAFPKTWVGFKNITLARSDFLNYRISNNTSDLDNATNRLIAVRQFEPLYIGSFELLLLSDISKSYLKINKSEKAISLYKCIANLKPFESNFGIGTIHNKLGHYDDSLNAFDNATKLSPRSFKVWYQKGLVLDNLHRYNESKIVYKKITEFAPESSEDWLYQGLAWKKLGNYERSIGAFYFGIKLDPKSSNLWHAKSGSYLETKEYDKAIKAVEKAISFNKEDENLWNSKGNALSYQRKYDEAIEAYDTAIELNSEFAWPWNNKGNALKDKENYNEAIQAYDRAIEIDPEYKLAWRNKGNLFQDLRKYNESLDAFEKAIEIDQNYTNAWNDKGRALAASGKYKAAIVAYNKATEIDPENKWAWNGKSNVLVNLKMYDEALKAADKALEIDPKYASAWNNKGNSLYRQGKYDEAIGAYDEAIKLDPKYAIAWNNKGSSLYRQGKTTEARTAFNKSKELGFEGPFPL